MLIIGSEGEDLYLDPTKTSKTSKYGNYEFLSIVKSGTKSGEISIKIKNSILLKILQKKIR